VFRRFGQSHRSSHTLSREQAKVFDAILACRTAALGGHLDVCEDCGFERPSYNSCFNRHCPKCQGIAAARWVEGRKQAILPVQHFHVVFTLPAELRPLALRNRVPIFDLLFEAASQTLLTLGADRRRLGALLGLSAVLHTWTRDLSFHPHLHTIVTAGGFGGDGWIGIPNERYLFPAEVMGPLFRGKFLAGLVRLHRKGRLDLGGSCAHLDDPEVFRLFLDKLYRTRWRPYAERPFAGPEQVFEYLGYYTHRVGISGHRLLAIDADGVRFKTKQGKSATLGGEEFIRRFLLHVLPRGFVKIRHYGLMAARAGAKRGLARDALAAPHPAAPDEPTPEPLVQAGDTSTRLLDALRTCPSCGRLSLVRRPFDVPTPHGRSPPAPTSAAAHP
jgi:hypothetical protein